MCCDFSTVGRLSFGHFTLGHLARRRSVARSGRTNLNDGGSYPASVGQHEREEQVGVDLVPEAAHLPEKENGKFSNPGLFVSQSSALPLEPPSLAQV